ncbi:carboxymuconolactone decarboxylase family protein [Sphingomonas sp. AOB5]|uniref:carboxymuconolactone decarboxylase family protein n=1 Tax=Sphingomonas sp. AOB5 TaxID=3034017 RepID=UPI0023F970C0|nr:carboxymuconolactone decarboxylase family protein [Sphingomonas sp. AOB5]MDF7775361.1 carboxymuconolactone decarboxylase family protein [Sphingomonas sp. AOB5]
MHNPRVPVSLVAEPQDEIVAEVFGRLAAGSVGVVNIHRTLANSPEVFAAFIGLAHALRFKTILDPAERELAILRALFVHHGDYEIGHHRRLGAAAGLSDAEMDVACSVGDGAGLTDRQRAILGYADAFAKGRGVVPADAAALTGVLDNRSVVELSLTLALYVGLAHLTASLDVPVD